MFMVCRGVEGGYVRDLHGEKYCMTNKARTIHRSQSEAQAPLVSGGGSTSH